MSPKGIDWLTMFGKAYKITVRWDDSNIALVSCINAEQCWQIRWTVINVETSGYGLFSSKFRQKKGLILNESKRDWLSNNVAWDVMTIAASNCIPAEWKVSEFATGALSFVRKSVKSAFQTLVPIFRP